MGTGLRWLSGFAGIAVCVLGATDARAGCEADTDCKGDRVCTDGECVEPAGSGACAADNDCPGELVCARGVCVDRTATAPAPVAATTPAAIPQEPTPPALRPGECKTDLDCTEGSCSRRAMDATGFCRMYRNEGAMIAGAFLFPIGTIGGPFSFGLATQEAAPGVVLSATSVSFFITWLVLLIYGAPRIPVRGEDAEDSARAGAPWVRATPGGWGVEF